MTEMYRCRTCRWPVKRIGPSMFICSNKDACAHAKNLEAAMDGLPAWVRPLANESLEPCWICQSPAEHRNNMGSVFCSNHPNCANKAVVDSDFWNCMAQKQRLLALVRRAALQVSEWVNPADADQIFRDCQTELENGNYGE